MTRPILFRARECEVGWGVAAPSSESWLTQDLRPGLMSVAPPGLVVSERGLSRERLVHLLALLDTGIQEEENPFRLPRGDQY